jgi:hypothetical protein
MGSSCVRPSSETVTPSAFRPRSLAVVGLVLASMALAVSPASAGVGPSTSGTSDGPLANPGAFRQPPAANRPQARWWWPGAAVTDAELGAEINDMADAGFGGVELSWLPTDLPGPTPGADGFGTADFARHVAAALRAGRSRGLSVDFTLGPAWPIATPVTTPENGLAEQELAYGARELDGPTTLTGPVPVPGGDDSHATLVAVTAAQTTDQTGASLLTPAGTPAHSPVMLDAGTAVDLTPKVDSSHNLDWTAPAGHWIVFAFWQRPTNQTSVVPTAFAQKPYVIDHFGKEAARAVSKYLDGALFPPAVRKLLPKVGGYLFEDSLELVTPNLLWTSDMAAEFRARRDYSLTKYLPALFIPFQHHGYFAGLFGNTPDFDFGNTTGTRVRHDFYRTLTDLYVANHLNVLRAYANSVGLRYRAQAAYDTTLEGTRAAQAPDGADTETLVAGDTVPAPAPDSPTAKRVLDFYRVTTSGAHMAGIKQVSVELAALQNVDFRVSQTDLKRLADKAYAVGATQMVLSGVAYQDVPGAAWPGWSPFSSEHPSPLDLGFPVGVIPLPGYSDGWTPAFPQWHDWPALNAYMGRANLVLESGKPQVDVVVYRGDDAFWGTFQPASPAGPYFDGNELAKRGYTYDFIDPVSLASAPIAASPGRLFPAGPSYRAIVVSNQEAMDPNAADRLLDAARRGVPVIFVGDTPTRSTSNTDPDRGDARVARDIAALRALANVKHVATEPDVAAALDALRVAPGASLSQPSASGVVPIHAVHRRTADADYWFLWNENAVPVSFSEDFEADGVPSRLDLWSGDMSRLAEFRRHGDQVSVPLRLGANESTVIAFSRGADPVHVVASDAEAVRYEGGSLRLLDSRPGLRSVTLSTGRQVAVRVPSLPAKRVLGSWALHVDGSAPDGDDDHDVTLSALADWRDIPGLADTSGVGTYRTSVVLGSDWGGAGAYLDLGAAEGSVRVMVNGRLATNQTIVSSPIDLGGLMQPGRNVVEVELATTLNNRLVASAQAGNPCCLRFATRSRLPAGLIGPVQLTPYANIEIPRR